MARAEQEAGKTLHIDEHGQGDNVALEDMSATALRKIVKKNGGTYTSKPAAIEFLRGD